MRVSPPCLARARRLWARRRTGGAEGPGAIIPFQSAPAWTTPRRAARWASIRGTAPRRTSGSSRRSSCTRRLSLPIMRRARMATAGSSGRRPAVRRPSCAFARARRRVRVPAATASPEVATVSPEVATVSPEVAACSHGGPNPQPVVAAGTGESGALLLTDDPLLDLNPPPRPRRSGSTPAAGNGDDAGVHETDSRGGNVEASHPATVSIDRALTTGAEPTEHVLGGRVAPAVASVQVTLSMDRSSTPWCPTATGLPGGARLDRPR